MADINGIPYVESGDLVSAYPTVSQNLAQEVSDQLATKPAKTSATTAPSTPATGDIWYDTNDTPPTAKFWDGSAWQPFSAGLGYAVISSPAATGQYTDGSGDTWDYFTFTASGSLVVDTEGLVQILAVGGGGGCADSSGANAGGGGGGVRFGIFEATAATHTVTIGAGGAGISGSGSKISSFGGETSVGTIVKIGGGSNSYARNGSLINFGSHGGGGGGGATAVTNYGTVNPLQAGAGAGGTVFGSNNWDGLANDYTGSSVTYGTGGEGNGAGSANTGDGGAYQGLAGGSGIVVVRVKV